MVWEKVLVFKVECDLSKLKYYVFEMFFYLLGKLYMGYVCNYMMGDVIVCYKMSMGYNVLYFMGFDVFGMLVENVVMVFGGYLKDWIYFNIDMMVD